MIQQPCKMLRPQTSHKQIDLMKRTYQNVQKLQQFLHRWSCVNMDHCNLSFCWSTLVEIQEFWTMCWAGWLSKPQTNWPELDDATSCVRAFLFIFNFPLFISSLRCIPIRKPLPQQHIRGGCAGGFFFFFFFLPRINRFYSLWQFCFQGRRKIRWLDGGKHFFPVPLTSLLYVQMLFHTV